jgi:hypothetical protein
MERMFELDSKKSKIVLDINELDEFLSSYLYFYETQGDIIEPTRKALLEIRNAVRGNNSSFEYNEKYGSIKYNINKLLPNNEHEYIKPRMLDLLEKIEQQIHEYFEFYNLAPHAVTGGKRKSRKSRKSRKGRKGRKGRKSRRKVRR